MKTYKEKFIKACKKISEEYQEGIHHHHIDYCEMCFLYIRKTFNNSEPKFLKKIDCLACPISKKGEAKGCVNHHTFTPSYSTTFSLRRALFYRVLAITVKDIPEVYFRPSIIRKYSYLRTICTELDKKIHDKKNKYNTITVGINRNVV